MSGNTFGSTTEEEEEEEEEPIACTEEAESEPLVCKPPELDAKYVSESTEKTLLRADYKFTTTKGTFTVRAYRALAPNAFDRFRGLVNEHFYRKSLVYRSLTGYGVQFGIAAEPSLARVYDPDRNETSGCVLADESEKTLETTTSNKRGWVAFGTSLGHSSSSSNTSSGDEMYHDRTSEIFVNMRDNSEDLDKKCVPFAEVTEGMDIVEKLYSGYGEMKDATMCNETQSLGFRCDGPRRGELYTQGYASVKEYYPNLDAILYAEEIAVQEKGSLIDARDGGGGFFYFILSCTVLGFLACFFRMHVVNRRRKTVARRASKYTAYVSSEQDDLSQLHQTLREQFAAANEGVSVDIKVESEKLKSRVIEQMNERRQARGAAANPFVSSGSLELEDGAEERVYLDDDEDRDRDSNNNNNDDMMNTIRF